MSGDSTGKSNHTAVITVTNNGGCVVRTLSLYQINAAILASVERHDVICNSSSISERTDCLRPNKRASLSVLINSAISEREDFTRGITGNRQRRIRASTTYPTETHLRFSRHSTNSKHPEGCKQEACLSINHLGLHGDRYRNPFDPLAGLEEISARSVRIPSSILPGFSVNFPCPISQTLNINKPRLHKNATVWVHSGYSTNQIVD